MLWCQCRLQPAADILECLWEAFLHWTIWSCQQSTRIIGFFLQMLPTGPLLSLFSPCHSLFGILSISGPIVLCPMASLGWNYVLWQGRFYIPPVWRCLNKMLLHCVKSSLINHSRKHPSFIFIMLFPYSHAQVIRNTLIDCLVIKHDSLIHSTLEIITVFPGCHCSGKEPIFLHLYLTIVIFILYHGRERLWSAICCTSFKIFQWNGVC